MQELCYFQKVEGEPVTSWGRARPRDVIIDGEIGGPEVPSTTKDDYVYLYVPFLGESGKVLEKNHHHTAGIIDADIECYTVSDIDTIPPFLVGIPIEEGEVDEIKSLYSKYMAVYDKSKREEEELERESSSRYDLSYVDELISRAKLGIESGEALHDAKKELVDYAEQVLLARL